MDNNDAGKGGTSPLQEMQTALEGFRQEVRLLVDMKVTKRAVALRKLLPDLDRLNKLGFTQEQLVEEMENAGLSMTLGYFKTAIWRLRKEDQQEK